MAAGRECGARSLSASWLVYSPTTRLSFCWLIAHLLVNRLLCTFAAAAEAGQRVGLELTSLFGVDMPADR